MIDELVVKNFQRHTKKTFRLGRVVTFTGKSGAGKSSALRALTWVLTNQPPGDEYLGEWGQAPFVSAQLLVDGHDIRRRRGKGMNAYFLDGEDMKSFSQGVPKPISDIVNVGEANFQGQFDPPLWFLDTAGEVSRQLNSIINLSLIDEVLSNAGKEVRRLKTETEICEKRLEEAKAKEKELAWAKELEVKLGKLDKLSEDARQLRLKVDQAEALAEALRKAENRTRTLQTAIKRERAAYARLSGLYETWKQEHEEAEWMAELVHDLQAAEHHMEAARLMIESESKQLKKFKRCPTCLRPL